jgi:hypothetical protein
MAKQVLDDLEAVRGIITALEAFPAADQERIIRWAREKLGLSSGAPAPQRSSEKLSASPSASATTQTASEQTKDIKTFVQAKNPQSDRQFAATVAYYYRFEAPDLEKKESITADDLQEATRKVGRDRLVKPAQTLINAHAQGLLDKATERGAYAINTVGENLVAMALPGGSAPGNSTSRRRPRRNPTKAAKRRAASSRRRK